MENAPYEFVLAKLLAADGAWQEAVEQFDSAVELAPDDPYLRLDYAGFLLQIGRRGKALEQATEARRLAPEDPDALSVFARAQLSVADGDPAAMARAREAYEELRRLRPDDLQGLIALGRMYLGGGRTEEAAASSRRRWRCGRRTPGCCRCWSRRSCAPIRSLPPSRPWRICCSADPAEARARLTLADLQQKRGDMRAAAETLRAAPAEVMEDLDYRRRLGFALYRVGELEASLEVVDTVLRDEPGDFGGLYLKGLIHAAEGHHERASALLRQLVAQRPQSLELALLAARVLERQQATEEAVALLAELAERLREADGPRRPIWRSTRASTCSTGPASGTACSRRSSPSCGGAGRRVSRPDLLQLDALAQSDRAAEALGRLGTLESPQLTPARRLGKEAELLYPLERDAEAEARLAELVKLPGDEGRFEAARLLQSRERYAEAIPLLEELRQQSTDRIQLLFWLGAAYERTARHEEAEEAFRTLLRIDADFAPALNYLGYMWADQGRDLEGARSGGARRGARAGQRRLRRLIGLGAVPPRPLRAGPGAAGAGGAAGARRRGDLRAPGRPLPGGGPSGRGARALRARPVARRRQRRRGERQARPAAAAALIRAPAVRRRLGLLAALAVVCAACSQMPAPAPVDKPVAAPGGVGEGEARAPRRASRRRSTGCATRARRAPAACGW